MRLPENLARQFPDLESVILRRGGLMPRMGGGFLGQSTVSASTLWQTVYFGAHESPDADILLHELRHVEQFRESRAFPAHYIWESLKRGYHHNRYEVDARQYAARRLAQAARTRVEEA
jgi:hypothetical protein